MSKLSISDLHHANELSFVETVKLHDGDVLKAAAERAIAAREIAGGVSKLKPSPGIGVPVHPPILVGLIAVDPHVNAM
jgi:hypothetical protein